MPDGPFYIHHRSTKADSPLASVVSCSHVHCFQHNHHSYNVSARTGQCQDSRRLLSAAAPRTPPQTQDEESSSSSSSRTSSRNHSRTPSSSGEGHSLLENHIASIGHWLSLNS
ncbi:hypothetical protein BGZ82_007124 [Podila clonocystis]|nr:hypothetical protein BGZ82_007124 [Podila clonocystis]